MLDYGDGQEGVRYITWDNKKVSYGILAPSFRIENILQKFQIILGLNTHTSTIPFTIETSKGIFGKSNLPSLLKPGIQSIQGQIESYIDKNMEACTDDFSIFESQGYDIEMKNTKSAVTIGNSDVFCKNKHNNYNYKSADAGAFLR